MKAFIRIIDLLALDYDGFCAHCRALPEQWSVPVDVDPSFAQIVGFKIVEMPDVRPLDAWESASLVGKKNGIKFNAEWIYSDVEGAELIKKNTIAEKRYQVEVNGIIEHNGFRYPTDEKTQSKFDVIYMKAKLDPSLTVPAFKSIDGFVSLSNSDIISIGDKIYAHVQAAFAREGELSVIAGASYKDW